MSNHILSNFELIVDNLQILLANQREVDLRIDSLREINSLPEIEKELAVLRIMNVSQRHKKNVHFLERIIDNICLGKEIDNYLPLQRKKCF